MALIVTSHPLDIGHSSATAWQIIGDTLEDVQDEMTKIMGEPDVGSAEFRRVSRIEGGEHRGKYITRGYTIARPCPDCPADELSRLQAAE